MSAIPFVDLQAQRARLGPALDQAIAEVLDHGQFIMGPEVGELERRLAAWSGAAHVVSCASGTDALLLPLLAWGIGPGDAVFVPGFTFTATAEVVRLVGASPVFVDVDDDGNLAADDLGSALDAVAADHPHLRPAAVLPVDLFGQPADLGPIEAVAGERGVRVLADAAQSLGATYQGRRVGTIGAATATSFFPSKPLGCYGDGGAVLTDDAELAEVLRSLRVHGQGSHKYDAVRVGVNARLDTLQAAILLVKLAVFDEELERRDVVAGRYTEALAGQVRTPVVRPGRTSTWAQYTIRVPERDRVAEELRRAGIPVAIHYPIPLHRQAAYAGDLRAPHGLPTAERLAGEVLSLPMHAYLEPPDQDRVIEAVLGAT